MMKQRKFAVLAVMILMFSLLLSACSNSQTAHGASDEMLDLDYVSTGNDAAEEEQADEPWYAWIKRAFSFGKTDVEETAEAKPDSVSELYKKGTENLQKQVEDATQVDEPEETSTDSKAATDSGKKTPGKKNDDSKKTDDNDQKQEDQNTPAQDTPQQEEPEQTGNTVTLTIRCDTAVNNGMHLESKWAGIVPASGCILDTTTFEFEDGDTVFDVLCQARDKYKLHMKNKEFDKVYGFFRKYLSLGIELTDTNVQEIMSRATDDISESEYMQLLVKQDNRACARHARSRPARPPAWKMARPSGLGFAEAPRRAVWPTP